VFIVQWDKKSLEKLALQYVWLLRKDVRKGALSSAPPTSFFYQWWILQGRSEYRAWDSLTDKQRDSLRQLTTAMTIDGVEIKLPHAISLIANLRADVREKFTENGKLNALALAGWFFMMGIKEHALEPIIDDELIRMLDKPLISQNNSESSLSDGKVTVPSLTILMRLIWEMLDSSIKKNMPLDKVDSRENFIHWFFGSALKSYPLGPLLANRWKCWLLQDQLAFPQAQITVPRFALIDYQVQPELRKQFNLDSIDGAKGLLNWSKTALADKWSWLLEEDHLDSKKSIPIVPLKQRPFGVNLYGFAFGELGIGEDLRMAVAACESAGIPYRIVNINAGNDLRQNDVVLSQQVEDSLHEAPYAINIFCLPAFDMVARVFLKMGPEHFDNHYNIGWWPWELSTWPAAWGSVFDLVDEVWSGSSFSLETYQKNTLKPCFLMPLATNVDRVKTLTRKHFGLPKTAFLFLYVLDFNSSLNRKNPHALVEAFKQAFGSGDRSVALVLKIMNVSEEDSRWQEFKSLCAQDSRIHILNTTMDRPEILGLIKVCDAYVSPHRAEGFGRTLAEAMLFGKPVVATNYSGNVDFMEPSLTLPVDYELVPVGEGDYHFVEPQDQAVWAEPSIAHLAEQMQSARLMAKNPEQVKSIMSYARQELSVGKTAKLLKARLSQIQTQLSV
jgi:glycosyltransferase involved in cell wall biosynthesis